MSELIQSEPKGRFARLEQEMADMEVLKRTADLAGKMAPIARQVRELARQYLAILAEHAIAEEDVATFERRRNDVLTAIKQDVIFTPDEAAFVRAIVDEILGAAQ